jgi:DMSO reductase anchor subunit
VRPTYSVILFTSSSGAGYGLLIMLALFSAIGLVPADRWLGLAGLGIAFLLITLGLLSSLAHLGHPERAWRALSQWRSSWLSREGVAALLTYPPAILLGIGWVIFEDIGGVWRIAGLVALVTAALTVMCTGMIYASLKPVGNWHHPLVVPVYGGFALSSGTLLSHAVLLAFGEGGHWSAALALALLLGAWLLKHAYWRSILADQKRESQASVAEATMLQTPVRTLERPHTGDNYLLHEMAFRVARKHRARLRRLSYIVGGLLPAVLLIMSLSLGGGFGATITAVAAAILLGIGIVLERWLFFAEARHTVALYYGVEDA